MLKSNAIGTETFEEWLSCMLPSHWGNVVSKSGDTFIVSKQSSVINVLQFLQNNTNCQFKVLSDIVVVDYPSRAKRFEVNYLLLSTRFSRRLVVKVSVHPLEGVPSAVTLFQSSGWFEREGWDMFGVHFIGNPNLSRLLTDYGFVGHPLRKDFPLTGFTEVRYDEEKKRVSCDPIEFSQAFRSFDYKSSWRSDSSKNQLIIKTV